MKYHNISIISVSSIDAPHKITSESLEKELAETNNRLSIPPKLLQNLSGIMERRFWDEGVAPSEVATEAAEKAILKAGIDRKKIGVLINTSVCRDYVEPSTACLVHGKLGLPSDCINFDISNACLGFINGLDFVSMMIERGEIDYGLIVDGEGSRYTIEKTIEKLLDPACDDQTYRDNFATLTLGSGAAAMVVGRSDLVPEGHVYVGSVTQAATEHNRLCIGQYEGMVTKTKELLIAGLQLAHQTWLKAKEEFNWNPDDLAVYVTHQVSKVHTEQFAATVGIELKKLYTIYQNFGNVGPAGIPIVLAKAEEDGWMSKGDRIALMGIGSGINCTMGEVIW